MRRPNENPHLLEAGMPLHERITIGDSLGAHAKRVLRAGLQSLLDNPEDVRAAERRIDQRTVGGREPGPRGPVAIVAEAFDIELDAKPAGRWVLRTFRSDRDPEWSTDIDLTAEQATALNGGRIPPRRAVFYNQDSPSTTYIMWVDNDAKVR